VYLVYSRFKLICIPQISRQTLIEQPTLAIVCNHYAPNQHQHRSPCADIFQVLLCFLIFHNSIQSHFSLDIKTYVINNTFLYQHWTITCRLTYSMIKTKRHSRPMKTTFRSRFENTHIEVSGHW